LTVSVVVVAVAAVTDTGPDEPVNTIVLLAGLVAKPDPVSVRAAPIAALLGAIDDKTGGVEALGGVKPVPVPAATFATIRRLRVKNSSTPYSGCEEEM
jgi:hypothetical protein